MKHVFRAAGFARDFKCSGPGPILKEEPLKLEEVLLYLTTRDRTPNRHPYFKRAFSAYGNVKMSQGDPSDDPETWDYKLGHPEEQPHSSEVPSKQSELTWDEFLNLEFKKGGLPEMSPQG